MLVMLAAAHLGVFEWVPRNGLVRFAVIVAIFLLPTAALSPCSFVTCSKFILGRDLRVPKMKPFGRGDPTRSRLEAE